MSRLIELVKEDASIEAIKADLWDNRGVAGYVNIQRRPHGMTALMCAVKNDNLSVVELLLQEGVNVNTKNYYGNSALIWACRYGFNHIIEKLLLAGADVNLTTFKNGRTPLMEAVYREDIEQVKILLQHGANANLCDNRGIPSIRWAIFRNNVELIKILLDAGANTEYDLNNIRNHSNPEIRSLLKSDNYAVINGKRYLLVESPSK
jgi:ankyrin repeat protein